MPSGTAFPSPADKRGEAPFSIDANLLHTSSEGKILEDPWIAADPAVYSRTADPETAPDAPQLVDIGFERGDAAAIDGEALSPAALLARLNDLGRRHGIGRLDLVENRFVGMKSRGIYETPGGTILLAAHRGIESLTLDRGAAHLKDELMPRYAELIYNGLWFSPEREMLQAAIDSSQACVTGTVRLKLYKGGAAVVGRASHAQPLQRGACDLRGGRGLRPARRHRLHPSQRLSGCGCCGAATARATPERGPSRQVGRAARSRGRCRVPTPAVMNRAVALSATSAVCQVPGGLMAYWPGPSTTVAAPPSASS